MANMNLAGQNQETYFGQVLRVIEVENVSGFISFIGFTMGVNSENGCRLCRDFIFASNCRQKTNSSNGAYRISGHVTYK